MSEPFIAQIMIFGGNFAPRGWAFCEGQILPISQNTALFSIIGTTYGGDGRVSFGLPDLRGRVPISPGNGPGLSSYRWGERGGIENVTLNTTQIPSHTHTAMLKGENRPATSVDPTGNMLAGSEIYRPQAASDDVFMDPAAISMGNTGGNLSHTNIQPFLAVYYIIALFGIFPSRN
jgi:microcystin-dependent protein